MPFNISPEASKASPLNPQNARMANGCHDCTRSRGEEPITNPQCGTATECCPDANIFNATAVNNANLTGWTIGVSFASWEAAARCLTIDTKPSASCGTATDTRSTRATFHECGTRLAGAAWSCASPIVAHTRCTLISHD